MRAKKREKRRRRMTEFFVHRTASSSSLLVEAAQPLNVSASSAENQIDNAYRTHESHIY
jgi:hypothetical protein